MKLILKKKVDKLGEAGDLVDVKPGYGRNFLLPQGLALPATESNIRDVENRKKAEAQRLEEEKKQVESLAGKLEELSLTIPVAVGESDKLYGSVTAMDIEKALAGQGIELDRKYIQLEEPIRELGRYQVDLRLQHGHSASLKVWVVKE